MRQNHKHHNGRKAGEHMQGNFFTKTESTVILIMKTLKMSGDKQSSKFVTTIIYFT